MVSAKKIMLDLIDIPATLRNLREEGFNKGSWQFATAGQVEFRAWRVKKKK